MARCGRPHLPGNPYGHVSERLVTAENTPSRSCEEYGQAKIRLSTSHMLGAGENL
jgi:hypothetical protein